jgi:hydrogenase-1 operon protein HyaE
MHSPLLKSVIERHGYPVIDHEEVDRFAARHEHVVLFFAGDAERLGESNDVAVVLPELHKAFAGAFVPAVVARGSERALQRRFRFNAFPSLVFLRRGEYLGAIQRVLDWADYLAQTAEILRRQPSEPPPFRLPDGCAASAPELPH